MAESSSHNTRQGTRNVDEPITRSVLNELDEFEHPQVDNRVDYEINQESDDEEMNTFCQQIRRMEEELKKFKRKTSDRRSSPVPAPDHVDR